VREYYPEPTRTTGICGRRSARARSSRKREDGVQPCSSVLKSVVPKTAACSTLLGASPGASMPRRCMLNLMKRVFFPEPGASAECKAQAQEINPPPTNQKLAENAALLREVRLKIPPRTAAWKGQEAFVRANLARRRQPERRNKREQTESPLRRSLPATKACPRCGQASAVHLTRPYLAF